ncbi:MAG: hypothetical protein M3P34_07965 [Actinomycetota bacterium]|nr:hypothetical protein [Actinomycetota bacterium]
MAIVLRPELVPSPLWGISLHRLLPDKTWRRLRKEIVAEHDDTCDYCGAVWETRMVCHEEWHYDDELAVATLTGFAVSCQLCNFALHIGRAQQFDRSDEAIEQMMNLNAMSREEVRRLIAEAVLEHKARSTKRWSIRIADDVVGRFPFVEGVLPESSGDPTSRRPAVPSAGS